MRRLKKPDELHAPPLNSRQDTQKSLLAIVRHHQVQAFFGRLGLWLEPDFFRVQAKLGLQADFLGMGIRSRD